MKTRITHFANVRIGQEFFSVTTGRRFERIKRNWARDNAYCPALNYFARFGGNQFVKEICKAKPKVQWIKKTWPNGDVRKAKYVDGQYAGEWKQ